MSASADTKADPESPKRRAILDAAAGLFTAQGYGAVSMDAVARAASVSKATLYAHFASKDQLFATIMEDGCRSKIEAADFLSQAAIGDSADLREALQTFGERMLRFLMEPHTLAIYRVVVAESVRFPELGAAFHDHGPAQFRRFFAGWLKDKMQAGLLRETDAETAAQQFIALIRGSMFLRASLGLETASDDATLARHVGAVVDTFLRAFGRDA